MLNLGHDLDASELASWPHVKGIFRPMIRWKSFAKD